MVLFCFLPASSNAKTVIKESQSALLPDIVYSDENGKEQPFNANRNKLTALHFWATWCVPCIKELPQVNAVQKKYSQKGFKVIALSLDGKNTDKVRKFYKENSIDSLDALFDSSMTSFQQLKVRGLPTTIFVNEEGKVIARTEGNLDWESREVESFIEQHL